MIKAQRLSHRAERGQAHPHRLPGSAEGARRRGQVRVSAEDGEAVRAAAAGVQRGDHHQQRAAHPQCLLADAQHHRRRAKAISSPT